MTVKVEEPVAPGATVRNELLQAAIHPAGEVAARLKFELAQAELSLFFTLAVKLTGVPATTY